MNRLSKLAVAFIGLVIGVGFCRTAWGFWATNGTGDASAMAGTLTPPTGVTGTQPTSGIGTVHVSWTPPGAPSAVPTGYYVQRFVGSSASAACGSSPTSLLSSTTTACDDTGVPAGSYTYKVTAKLGSWTATSGASNAVNVTVGVANISPTSGTVNTTVTLAGSGFPPNATITASYDGASVTLSGTTTTDASGNIPTANPPVFAVPASITGSHAVVVTAGSASTAPVNYTVQSAVVLAPNHGVAYSSDTISGTGFRANTTITATFGGVPVTLSGTTATDAKGSFSAATFTVPNNAQGSYNVIVSDGSSSANASYSIDTPTISITNPTPAQGVVGTTATVSGTNFPAGQALSATFGGSSVSLSASSTNASGAFTATFTVPAKPAGSQTLIVTAATRLASTPFTVQSSVGAPNPTSQTVSSSVTISGSGFAATSPLTIKVGGTAAAITAGASSDTNGGVNATFTVPPKPAGSYAVSVTDAASNSASSTTNLTITASATGLTPTSGPVGTSATITANGFIASHALAVTVGGTSATITTGATTDANGSSALTFTIPSVTSGAKTVTISDGTNSASSSTNFTVTVSSVSGLSPTSGSVGTVATINASNFIASHALTVTVGGAAVTITSGGTSNGSGGSTITFTVPAAPNGPQAVVVSDGTNNATSGTNFTVSASATGLTPSSGIVGSTATITANGFIASRALTVTVGGTSAAINSGGTTATNGSSTITFTIPSLSSGANKTVTVSDGTNSANSAQLFTVQPAIKSIDLQNVSGGTPGKIEKGDKIVLTFSDQMKVSSFCSNWSVDTTNQSLTGNNDVTVTINDNAPATGNDTLTVSAVSTACPTWNFGTIDLGTPNYVTGGSMQFNGNGSGKSTVTWDAAAFTLTVVLGTKAGTGTAGTVSSTTPVFTLSPAVTDSAGLSVANSPFTLPSKQYF